MTASGKSTLAKKLVKRYGLDYVCGGNALKKIAREKGYRYSGPGWWETHEGQAFLRRREKDPTFDKKVDRKLIQIAKTKRNVLLDSWTLAWLFNEKNTLKIWLKCSQHARARRAAKRDRTSIREAQNALRNKDEESKSIYRDLYGFRLEDDLAPFDLAVDTSRLDEHIVYRIVSCYIDNMLRAGYIKK